MCLFGYSPIKKVFAWICTAFSHLIIGCASRYHEQQNHRGTKLSWFTGFLQNVGKTVVVLLNYNIYFNEPLKLVEKTFVFYQNPQKFCTTGDLLFTVSENWQLMLQSIHCTLNQQILIIIIINVQFIISNSCTMIEQFHSSADGGRFW